MYIHLKERKNYITIAILLFLLIVTLSACGASQARTGPASVIQDYFKALGAGDIEGAQALIAEDATFDILGEVLDGKAQILDYNQEAVLENPSFELSNIHVDGDKVTYTNSVTIDSTVYKISSEATIQEGKITSIIDRSR